MLRLPMTFAGIAVWLTLAPWAFAQHIAIQEPSLETFGVGTTVSAPDRGRVSLGGVSRGRSSRSTYGPFRSGTNMGLSSQATSVGVGVRVHDLAELDRQALNAADKVRRARDDVALSPAAERAYETLRARSAARDVARGGESAIVGAERQAPGSPNARITSGPPPEKLLDRARQAEAAGKRGLALAFLRTARDAGSVEAEKEIDRLSKKR